MRLLNPGPGEVYDRLTILELKIKALNAKGGDIRGVLAERLTLMDHLIANGQKQYVVQDLVAALAETNRQLWEMEDEVRELPEVVVPVPLEQWEKTLRLAELAKKIARMNDLRAELVQKVNQEFGIKEEPEKVYRSRGLIAAT